MTPDSASSPRQALMRGHPGADISGCPRGQQVLAASALPEHDEWIRAYENQPALQSALARLLPMWTPRVANTGAAVTSNPITRRLVAIVIADVVGYTRLMEQDEGGTHTRLHEIRDEVVDPQIAAFGGRVVR